MNTNIKCGNCQHTHESVEAVKACYASGTHTHDHGTFVQEEDLLPCEVAALASGKVAPSTFQAPAITPKQENFLNSLLAERPMFRDVENLFPDNVAKMTKAEASIKIGEVLKVAKEATVAKAADASVPEGIADGYYAIDIDGTVKFYRVDMPTEGKWAGRTFLSVQASDEFHAIRNAATRGTVLAAIVAQGVKESMVRYGLLIGRCGVCNRTLTDETSRAMGIGPVCREKF